MAAAHCHLGVSQGSAVDCDRATATDGHRQSRCPYRDFLDLGPKMGSRRAGRGLKRFLEAVGFILAKFERKASHGDPIYDQNYGFGTYDFMCKLGTQFLETELLGKIDFLR